MYLKGSPECSLQRDTLKGELEKTQIALFEGYPRPYQLNDIYQVTSIHVFVLLAMVLLGHSKDSIEPCQLYSKVKHLLLLVQLLGFSY